MKDFTALLVFLGCHVGQLLNMKLLDIDQKGGLSIYMKYNDILEPGNAHHNWQAFNLKAPLVAITGSVL